MTSFPWRPWWTGAWGSPAIGGQEGLGAEFILGQQSSRSIWLSYKVPVKVKHISELIGREF